MSVHQCPRCELRFRDLPEVQSHLADDHGVDPESIESRLTGTHGRVGYHRDIPDPVREARAGDPQAS